jgi:anthranilate synthase/aminodeoxychorismate synthase-like glutamine amidotransferase
LRKKVVLIDNYDSFTYNLAQSFQVLGAEVQVFRNDEVTVEEVENMNFSHLAISPGPGVPEDSGIILPLVERMKGKVSILGVCLGHQAIGEGAGARLIRAPRPVHGKSCSVVHDSQTIFAGIDNPMVVGRYHSLMLDEESLPDCLEISARTLDGLIMGIRWKGLAAEGVQFHPESILTPQGMLLIENFLRVEV